MLGQETVPAINASIAAHLLRQVANDQGTDCGLKSAQDGVQEDLCHLTQPDRMAVTRSR